MQLIKNVPCGVTKAMKKLQRLETTKVVGKMRSKVVGKMRSEVLEMIVLYTMMHAMPNI